MKTVFHRIVLGVLLIAVLFAVSGLTGCATTKNNQSSNQTLEDFIGSKRPDSSVSKY